MSPEQVEGDPHQLGPLSDIYSLGAVLYACLTSRPPFVAASAAETIAQVLQARVVAPRCIVPTFHRTRYDCHASVTERSKAALCIGKRFRG